MRNWALVGLLMASMASAPVVLAHAQGVTHTYENGAPVITVRIVPDEGGISRANRINALDPAPSHAAPAQDEFNAAEPASAVTGAIEGLPLGEGEAPPAPEAVNEIPPDEEAAAPGAAAAVTRYPLARPVLKPNTETGVGGALDLAPPAAEAAQPRPMRLNSVQRPRNVAVRAQRPAREQRARQPARAVEPDPLDEALPPRVIDAPAVNAMQLPPPKTEDRIAGGN